MMDSGTGNEPTPGEGHHADGHESELPRRKGASIGKWLMILMSSMLLIPLGTSVRHMFAGCDSMQDRFAEAYGDEIEPRMLRYQLVREQGFGGKATRPGESKSAAMRRVLDRVLTVYVLAHRAEEQGVDPTDAEVAAFIKDPARNGDLPLYSTPDGRLDPKLYKKVLQYGFHLGTTSYERYKRRELMAWRALDSMGDSAKGPVVTRGLHAVEIWLFHPMLAARLGAKTPGPGDALWSLVEEAMKAGDVRINEAKFLQVQ